jgi:hypothetical protein
MALMYVIAALLVVGVVYLLFFAIFLLLFFIKLISDIVAYIKGEMNGSK